MQMLFPLRRVQRLAFSSIQLDQLKEMYLEIFSTLNLVFRLSNDPEIEDIKKSTQEKFGTLHNQLADKIIIK